MEQMIIKATRKYSPTTGYVGGNYEEVFMPGNRYELYVREDYHENIFIRHNLLPEVSYLSFMDFIANWTNINTNQL